MAVDAEELKTQKMLKWMMRRIRADHHEHILKLVYLEERREQSA